MDADRLTTKSQEAVSTAVRTAATQGHPEVAPVHLLLALLDQGDGITGPLLAAVGADPKTVRTRADRPTGPGQGPDTDLPRSYPWLPPATSAARALGSATPSPTPTAARSAASTRTSSACAPWSTA